MYSINRGLLVYLFEGNTNFSVPEFVITYSVFILVTIVSAYLLGSLNSAIIISRTLYKDDIRKHGSGNAGMTNMLRTYGMKAAGLTLLGDMLKNVIAIFIAAVFFGFNYIGGISDGDGYCYLAGLFAILGHVFPVYYKFKGGKGVLSVATVALILTPIPFAILLAIFVAIVAMSKYVSLGSVSAVVLYPVLVNGYFNLVLTGQTPGIISLTTISIAILVVWCHRTNLVRISNRTENKLSFGKKKKNDDDEAAE